MKIVDRFLKYVSFDTQSDEKSNTFPSTSNQRVLADYLVKELKEIGISNAYLDDYGIVYASIEGNTSKGNKIAYIAHMDTAPDASGKDIKPRIINNYDLTDIKLNDTMVLSPDKFPSLLRHKSKDLIVTDGKTLLGADDKAGIAIIISFAEKIIKEKIEHNDIYIAFTPDEEIGKGTENFDISKFNADFAYTIDGGAIEYVEYENFNAASAVVSITGLSVHPGSAKNKMINASSIAMEFDRMLPTFQRPEYTENYEGFNHLTNINGSCEKAELSYIIRNHDKYLLEKQKNDFKNIKDFLNIKYPSDTINIKITDTYSNMYEIVKKFPKTISIAEKAIKNIVGKVDSIAIRGGTDGAMLSYKGLPCPNLGGGGYNFHGPYEYLCIDEMKTMVDVLTELNNINISK
jgi:tripeptide aminopeptidase